MKNVIEFKKEAVSVIEDWVYKLNCISGNVDIINVLETIKHEIEELEVNE